MAGYFISLFFSLVPYALCFLALMCDGGYAFVKNLWHSLSLFHKLLMGLFVLVITSVAVFWVHQDRYIYYWDYAGYWTKSLNRMRYMLWHSAGEIFSSLVRSINEDTYNLFLPTITAFPRAAFGYTYPTYVMINFLLLQVPSAFIMALAAAKAAGEPRKETAGFFMAACFAALLFPACFYATFRGYIDAGFLLFASVAIYLLADYDFSKVSVTRNAFLALMFVLTWISRRYTVYLIIGFVAVLVIKACVSLAGKTAALGKVAVNFLLVGGISLGFLLLFFRQFFLNALLTDYGTMYSAYNAPLSEKFAGLIQSFGYITVFLCGLGLLICIIQRRNLVNAVCWTAMLLMEPAVFWQTQTMGVQHLLILFPPAYMLCMLCLDVSPAGDKNGNEKNRGPG